MLDEAEVPVLGMVQVGETAVDERAHEVEGQRGTFVGTQHQLGVGLAFGRGKARAIDDVAAIAWQRHAVARLRISGTWLRILACESPYAHDRLLETVQQ